MSVDLGLRDWLTGEAKWAAAAPLAAPWAAAATPAESVSPFATQAGAQAEAARQRALQALPLARDRHTVPGLRSDLLGRRVTLRGPRLGYDAGVTCLVIGTREMDGPEQTELTVLRRLS